MISHIIVSTCICSIVRIPEQNHILRWKLYNIQHVANYSFTQKYLDNGQWRLKMNTIRNIIYINRNIYLRKPYLLGLYYYYYHILEVQLIHIFYFSLNFLGCSNTFIKYTGEMLV